VAQKLHVRVTDIYKSSRARADRGGGTWVHWQIAAAYATYLDEELHIQFNAAVIAGPRFRSAAVNECQACYRFHAEHVHHDGPNPADV
jgi:hypothetical protein